MCVEKWAGRAIFTLLSCPSLCPFGHQCLQTPGLTLSAPGFLGLWMCPGTHSTPSSPGSQDFTQAEPHHQLLLVLSFCRRQIIDLLSLPCPWANSYKLCFPFRHEMLSTRFGEDVILSSVYWFQSWIHLCTLTLNWTLETDRILSEGENSLTAFRQRGATAGPSCPQNCVSPPGEVSKEFYRNGSKRRAWWAHGHFSDWLMVR